MKVLMFLCGLVTVVPASALKAKLVGIKTGGTLIGESILPDGSSPGAEMDKAGLSPEKRTHTEKVGSIELERKARAGYLGRADLSDEDDDDDDVGKEVLVENDLAGDNLEALTVWADD